ncbi:MAG: FMN-binding protein [Pseudomonadota bacterium]
MSDRTGKNSKINVILFSLLLSIICSLMITLAAGGLKDRQMVNMALDKKINILKAADLKAFKLITPEKPSKNQIDALYNTHIQEVMVDDQGKIINSHVPNALTLFLIKADDILKGYILPITTQGLWGKIQGYLAFENDGQTVSGFSVFSHSETPGLGGEIESAWFQKNFKGKKIINSQNQFVSVGIAKGKAANLSKDIQSNYVDGISGATLTGKYLSQGIKETLMKTNPITIKLLQRQLKTQASTAPKSHNPDQIIQKARVGDEENKTKP